MKLRKNQIISPKILTISSGGNQKYLPSYVLFLKKVHSWEGVTEMVLGLFLLFL